jgi:regulator of replication initiation timing
MFLQSGQDAKCVKCGNTLLGVQMTVERPTPKQALLNKLAELDPEATAPTDPTLEAVPSEDLEKMRSELERLTRENTELRLSLQDANSRIEAMLYEKANKPPEAS